MCSSIAHALCAVSNGRKQNYALSNIMVKQRDSLQARVLIEGTYAQNECCRGIHDDEAGTKNNRMTPSDDW